MCVVSLFCTIELRSSRNCINSAEWWCSTVHGASFIMRFVNNAVSLHNSVRIWCCTNWLMASQCILNDHYCWWNAASDERIALLLCFVCLIEIGRSEPRSHHIFDVENINVHVNGVLGAPYEFIQNDTYGERVLRECVGMGWSHLSPQVDTDIYRENSPYKI